MLYEAFQPLPAIRPYIRSIYLFVGDGGDLRRAHTFRFASDGGPEILINLADPFAAGSSEARMETFPAGRLIGPLSRHLLTRSTGQTAFVAVSFRPGGIAPLFGIPDNEFTDQSVVLDTLWGACGRQLEELVQTATSPNAAIDALQSALCTRLNDHGSTTDRRIQHAIDLIAFNRGRVRVGQLARTISLSRRQFERRFHQVTGLSPKRLCRILRFAHLRQQINQEPRPSWSQLALTCGYSDQAHMIRECRFFTGYSPQAYLIRRPPLENAFFNQPSPMSHFFNTIAHSSDRLPPHKLRNAG